jgi:5-methylcytosine-specific restriction endonuclease McrA
MTFEQLREFLLNRMKMSHIYQPLLIRSLVESGGQATLRQLAAEFLIRDESQILYYEKRLKEMPVRILKKHGVIENDGHTVRLVTGKLDLRQRAELRRICEEKICNYIEARGIKVWSYESLDLGVVSDDLRYRVLKEGGSRCALCGARGKDTPLDVDHIIPRSKKGSNDISNLQILCAKCNRTKRDRDDEDFRPPRQRLTTTQRLYFLHVQARSSGGKRAGGCLLGWLPSHQGPHFDRSSQARS